MFALRIAWDAPPDNSGRKGAVRRAMKLFDGAGLQKAAIPEGLDLYAADAPHGPDLHHCAQTGKVICLWGFTTQGDAHALMQIYRRDGSQGLEAVRGDFALVLVDPRARRLVALRDGLGIKPLYWCETKGALCVAGSLPLLEAVSGAPFELDHDWVIRAVAGLSMSRSKTPFNGCAKLAPGHLLQASGVEREVRRVHAFDPSSPPAHEHDASRVSAYRSLLDRAAVLRVPPTGDLAIEVSGGLDSSTVLGLVAAARADGARGLHGFAFVGFEMEPLRVLQSTAWAGCRETYVTTQRDEAGLAAARTLAWQVLGHPAEHGICLGHTAFYGQARKLGYRAIYSGFGGDEGVTNYGGVQLRELSVTRQKRALWRSVRGNAMTRPLRFLRHWIAPRRQLPVDLAMARGAERQLDAIPLTQEALDRIDGARAIRENANYMSPHNSINAHAIAMLEKPFVSTRTESCTLMAAAHGLDHYWPLLDVDLIEGWLTAPAIEKASGNHGRFLHRRAVEGIMPPAIQWQRGKHMGEPLARGVQAEQGPGPFKVAPAPLHRVLSEIVDIDRLAWLVASAQSVGDNPASAPARRSLGILEELNNWLFWRDERP